MSFFTPEEMRINDTKALADEVLDALGVNDRKGAAPILQHAIAQANLELGVVEYVLDQYETSPHQDLIDLRYLVVGIRARLSLAQNGASTLDRIINDKPWEAPQ